MRLCFWCTKPFEPTVKRRKSNGQRLGGKTQIFCCENCCKASYRDLNSRREKQYIRKYRRRYRQENREKCNAYMREYRRKLKKRIAESTQRMSAPQDGLS